MYSSHSKWCSHHLGFPIRKSPDHRLLASPRGLSQLTTSFIAYLRQGIHTHALSSLTIKFTLNTEYSSGQLSVASGCKSPPAPTTATLRYRSPYIGCMVTFCNFVVARQYSIVKDRGRRPGRNRVLPKLVWWAWVESNYRPHPYQGCALAN